MPELKAPFPYFGGKSLGAAQVWAALGDVRNYVEPFAGSLAVLLSRPAPQRGPETVNDWSCQLINAWRAIRDAPGDLAARCVDVVSEVDTEARHYQLVAGAADLRTALGDPYYFSLDAAAWYIKGACEWIGTGWASGDGPWQWSRASGWAKRGNAGTGVNRQLPHLGDAGTGVNRKLPHLGNAGTGQYEQRVSWLSEWLDALRDRLCSVRIACGDWKRVTGNSVTVKHGGVTGVFLDPPYASTEYCYGKQTDVSLSGQCRQWAALNGSNPKMRIVLAGRGTEHEMLEIFGWRRQGWATRKGYSTKAGDNATEAIWVSPACLGEEAPCAGR